MKKRIALTFLMASGLAASLAAQAQQFSHACLPTEIFATGNRVHVRCAHPENKFSTTSNRLVVYFAVPTTNKELSDRLLALGSVAIAHGKWLNVTYDDALGTSFGCAEHDCRPLVGVALHALPLPTPRPPVNAPVD